MKSELQRQLAALQTEAEALRGSREAEAAENLALQARLQAMEAEKAHMEQRIEAQVAKFGECKDQFGQLFHVSSSRVWAHQNVVSKLEVLCQSFCGYLNPSGVTSRRCSLECLSGRTQLAWPQLACLQPTIVC